MGKSDHRKKKRITMVAAAVVRPKLLEQGIEAYIINISYGGVGLYVKEAFEGRVQVTLSLSVGSGKRVSESVWGEVSWKKPVGVSYAIGIAFEDLNMKDHPNLLAFLDEWRPVQATSWLDEDTVPEAFCP